MKRSVFLILLLLVIPMVSAVDFEMKTQLDKGETLLAKVSGNFIDALSEDNVVFYKGHVPIPMVYDITKIEGEYYLYAILLGRDPGNYTLALEDVKYMKGAEVSEEDLVKEFVITENTALFSVNPGFIETEEGFSLEVQNLQDTKITVDINPSERFTAENFTTLISGEMKEIEFKLKSELASLNYVILSSGNLSYSVPVYLISEITTENPIASFEFATKIVDVTVATDDDTKIIIHLRNTGDVKIEDISFNMSPELELYIVISPETLNDLGKEELEPIDIVITSDVEEKTVEGEITAFSGNVSTSFTLILDFEKDFVPEGGETKDGKVAATCEELQGTVCKKDQECGEEDEGETIYTTDEICCRDTCIDVKKGSSSKVVGWAIVIIIILFVLWFFRSRYRRAGRGGGMSFGRGRRGRY
jgi:hypothetical protein